MTKVHTEKRLLAFVMSVVMVMTLFASAVVSVSADSASQMRFKYGDKEFLVDIGDSFNPENFAYVLNGNSRVYKVDATSSNSEYFEVIESFNQQEVKTKKPFTGTETLTLDLDGVITLTMEVTCTEKPVHHPAVEPKCLENGSIEYWTLGGYYYRDAACKQEIAADDTVLGATDHRWGSAAYTWSADFKTCTAEIVCLRDGTHKKTQTVNTEYKSIKDPDCTNEGEGVYTAVFTNPDFEKQVKYVTIGKTNHSFVNLLEWIWDGFKKATAWLFCSNNADHVMTADVPASQISRVDPTCTEDGYIVYTATIDVAGKEESTIKVETLDQIGHDWYPVYYWKYDGEDDGETIPEYYVDVELICNNDEDHKVQLNVTMERIDNADGSVTFIGHCEYEGVDYSDSFTVSLYPNTPDTPDSADTPDTPDASETSDTPDAPETSDTPDAPETSDTPDAPETADTPDAPETNDTPDAPDTPDKPDVPSTPDDPTPDTPDKPTPDTPDLEGILGDVNDDGVVDSADAVLILRNSVNMQDFTDLQKFLGDVDFDGMNITSADALSVLRYSVNIPDNDKIGTFISTAA